MYKSVKEIKYGKESISRMFNNGDIKNKNSANKMHNELEKFNFLKIWLKIKRKKKINKNSENKIE